MPLRRYIRVSESAEPPGKESVDGYFGLLLFIARDWNIFLNKQNELYWVPIRTALRHPMLWKPYTGNEVLSGAAPPPQIRLSEVVSLSVLSTPFDNIPDRKARYLTNIFTLAAVCVRSKGAICFLFLIFNNFFFLTLPNVNQGQSKA